MSVSCPLCQNVFEVADRCPVCTVNVRVVDGRVLVGGFAGSDMGLAGVWLRRLPSSRFEKGPVPKIGATRTQARCGTKSGYQAHHRRGEKACDECRHANAESARADKRAQRARAKAAA